jgi:excinuclease ABC subunit A
MDNLIKIRGARQHNLKNIDLDIPKNKLVVFTGISGSGKSSLAFDTIYAEGQRRYVESLSTYARQFLGVMEKPDVDLIEGLSPAISIDQKTTSRNPRSTVGTVTEIYDYLRLLYARIGHPHCPVCGREIASQSVDEIVEKTIEKIKTDVKVNNSARYLIMSPLVNDKKGEFSSLFDNLKAKGFKYVRVDGLIYDLTDDFVLIKTNKHTIEVVVDRISLSSADLKNEIFTSNLKSRLTESTETALKLSEGLVILSKINDEAFDMPEKPKNLTDFLFSEKFSCPVDNIQLPEIEPRTFSFNSPHGACPTCSGLGKVLKVDENLLFAEDISITEGAILPFSNLFENDTWYARLVLTVCQENGIDPKIPLKKLNEEQKALLLSGTGDRQYKVEGTNRFGQGTYIYEEYPGVIAELERRHSSTESDWVRSEIEKYMRDRRCPECNGARLKKEALSITVDKLSIHQATQKSVSEALSWFEALLSNKVLSEKEDQIGGLIIKEITTRLNFLVSVGLEYLTLNRSASTLSGGEAQRIRLASQIGSGLTGVLYVLDEPTIGLHQKDNQKLIDTLKKLRDLGNSVVVVEHDEEMMRQSDWIVDFGPYAGKLGGEVVAAGDINKIKKTNRSITGKYLAGKRKIITNGAPGNKNNELIIADSLNLSDNYNALNQKPSTTNLQLLGCSQFNLKHIDVEFPLSKLVVITGVSGSGKSTLLVETLYPALQAELNPHFKGSIGAHKHISGTDKVDKVILIDQSPIGRTPRSNPATYIKLFDHIRDVFASTKDAKLAGYKKGRFSFNVKGGRCEACEGQGQTKIEMQFMSDIWVTCDICKGKRYNTQTLEIVYRGKNISDVLEMTVVEALEFFHAHSPIVRKLDTLKAVGLDYIKLGQPATTLSGGEAQRIKLALELSKKDTGKTVYILDEPTTGLHFYDIQKLLNVLRLLVEKGNSIIVIEHNLDVIRNADWIIDLGPDGGEGGGKIVAQGKVDDIAKARSYTAKYLRNSTSK